MKLNSSTPIDHHFFKNSSLVVYRFGFGLMMFIAVVRFFVHGWIDEFYVKPKYFFPLYGFEWVHPWPRWGMHLHFALMGLAALGIAFGAFYRVCTVVFFVLFTYAHLCDLSHYLNHYYLISLLSFLMIFMPLHQEVSFDSYRKKNRNNRGIIPSWPLYVLRIQVGLVYFFAGVAKLQSDWLVHAQPMRYWLAAYQELPMVGWLCTRSWFAYFCSIFGAIFDLTIVFFLCVRTTRSWAYLVVIVFHTITYLLFPIGLFPFVMLLNATLFFQPNWPTQLVKKIRTVLAHSFSMKRLSYLCSNEPDTVREESKTNFSIGYIVLLVLYFTVQFTMPFRHLLYPGNVLWTEQGFNFSWKVMVMEKRGIADFYVEDQTSHVRQKIKLNEYFTEHQIRTMSSQPDMIAQAAWFIRHEYERRGWKNVAVYGDIWVSLNGRPSALFVDPKVDLSRAGWGLNAKTWLGTMPMN